MYTIYDELISEEIINGTLGCLIDKIVEDFANEEIDESKSREFYNVVGDLEIEEIEEYGVFKFSLGINMEFKLDLIKEEVTKEFLKEDLLKAIRSLVKRQLFERVMYDRDAYENIRLKLNNDSKVEATYKLLYN